MTRAEGLSLVRLHVHNENLVKHMLAAEAIMRSLARHFDEDEELWGLAGLVHDVDYELTGQDPMRHAAVGEQMLMEAGAPREVSYAVKVHNERFGEPRLSRMDKSLYCTDPLTGLITAAALVTPEKKLALVKLRSLAKRFKEPSFARGADREQIKLCSEIGLELEEFMGLGLEAMQGAVADLGL